MILNKNPMKNGLLWFKEGITLFRKSPFSFFMLALGFIFISSLLNFFSTAGSALALILTPCFILNYMSACQKTNDKTPFTLTLLFENFYKYPQKITIRLLLLGVICLISIFIATMLIFWLNGTVSTFASTLKAQILQNNLDQFIKGNLPLIASLAIVTNLLLIFLLWFTPMLCAWHNQPLIKAIFFNIVSVWKNKWPLLWCLFLWLLTTAIVFAIVSVIAFALISLKIEFIWLSILVSLLYPVMFGILSCCVYASYHGCFIQQNTFDHPQPVD